MGLRNYARVLHEPLFWQALRNTLYFALVGGPLTVAASLGAALLVNARGAALEDGRRARSSSRRSSRRSSPWRSCGSTCITRGTGCSTGCWPRRRPSDRLVGRSALGDAGHHPDGHVEELRLQHAHLHRRPAEHSARAVRGRRARRRDAVAALPARDAADARARRCSSSSSSR